MTPKSETALEKLIQDAERAHLENQPLSEKDLRQALQESQTLLAEAKKKIAELETQRAQIISQVQHLQRLFN